MTRECAVSKQPYELDNSELVRIDIEAMANHSGVIHTRPNPMFKRDKDWFSRAGIDPLQLLVMRLRRNYNPGEIIDWAPLEHIHVYVGEVKAFVMFVKDDTATTLEDDANLYPSDTLLAQLKLVMGI
jgi:hypothetical protein